MPAQDALEATLLYRTISFWLPLPAGGIAYLLFRRRYGRSSGGAPDGSEVAAARATLDPITTTRGDGNE